jgi:hypothetical protein
MTILFEQGRTPFGELGKKIWGTEWGESKESTLSRALKRLRSVGKVGQDGEFQPYYATDNCIEERVKLALRDTVLETNPISISPQAPWYMPMFTLGAEKVRWKTLFDRFFDATYEKFEYELQTRVREFERTQDRRIRPFLAELVWASVRHMAQVSEQFKHRHARDLTHAVVEASIGRTLSAGNLKTFIKLNRGLPIALESFVEEHFLECHGILKKYQWTLLEFALPHFDFGETEKIDGNLQKCLSTLSQPENKKLLESFLTMVRDIQFTFFISVGSKKIDQINWFAMDFERWISRLKAGELDRREQIFSEGLRNLERFRRKTFRAHGRMGLSKKDIFQQWELVPKAERKRYVIDESQIWDIPYLYKNHPRGKDPAFYDEISRMIRNRDIDRAAERQKLSELFDSLTTTKINSNPSRHSLRYDLKSQGHEKRTNETRAQ